MPVSELVQSVRRDVTRGASSVVRSAIEAYRAALDDADPAVELRPLLVELGRGVVRAQPAMAPLFNLARAVLRAIDGGPASAEAVRGALRDFEHRLERARRSVAERAEGLVPAGGRVMTISASATVRAALLHAASRRTFDVVCLEGRPNLEGRDFAGSLGDAGLEVLLAVDAAAASLLRGCDVVIVGADSIGELGLVNKIGTRQLALAARRCGVPIYALGDTTKLLPPGWPQALDDPREPDEVWDARPSNVTVWNQYFEATPVSYFDGFATEDGLRDAAEIEAARAQLDIPAELV